MTRSYYGCMQAGQFANPYSYGGDPVIYIDPTGMWSIGAAMQLGNNNEFGFNASYSWNQDGSNSLNVGVNVQVPIPLTPLWLSLGAAYSYNSYTGTSLTSSVGACIGASDAIACTGIEAGGGLYWDRAGSFLGATVFAGTYATFASGARISSGYEWGLMGMEGRGAYASASVFGLYASVSQNGGWDYGGEFSAYWSFGNNTGKMGADKNTESLLSTELWFPTIRTHFAFGETYDVGNEGLVNALEKNLEKEGILKKGQHINFEDPASLDIIHQALLNKGFSCEISEPNTFLNNHEGKKYKYKKNNEYGNIEIIRGEKNYSSYNYGNNRLTHLLIDYAGYRGRGYK